MTVSRFARRAALITGALIASAFFSARAPADEARLADSAGTGNGSISVECNIADAEVYLNDLYCGLTPLVIADVKPGYWRVTVRKAHYYPQSWLIRMTAGDCYEIRAVLEKITGKVRISGAPANAQFLVDDAEETGPVLTLPEGQHSITVRAFGYEERTFSVRVSRHDEIGLDGTLVPAAFTASGLGASRPAFNPESPANLGTTRIGFFVTAPGTAFIRIEDGDGTPVRTFTAGPFTSWRQSVRWDGRDENGTAVRDGTYRVRLEARGTARGAAVGAASDDGAGMAAPAPEAGEPVVLETFVAVDRSVIWPMTSAAAGAGSTGAVISGSLMPAGGALVQFDAQASPGGITPAISILLGLARNVEAGARAGVKFDGAESSDWDIAGGIKAGLSAVTDGGERLAGALSLRWATGTGMAFGPAFEIRAGRAAFSGNAEIRYGDRNGLFIENPAFSANAGLCARYAAGNASGGLWAAGESGKFGGNFLADGLVSVGATFQWILPATDAVLSAEAGFSPLAASADRFSFRGAFGILF